MLVILILICYHSAKQNKHFYIFILVTYSFPKKSIIVRLLAVVSSAQYPIIYQSIKTNQKYKSQHIKVLDIYKEMFRLFCPLMLKEILTLISPTCSHFVGSFRRLVRSWSGRPISKRRTLSYRLIRVRKD